MPYRAGSCYIQYHYIHFLSASPPEKRHPQGLIFTTEMKTKDQALAYQPALDPHTSARFIRVIP